MAFKTLENMLVRATITRTSFKNLGLVVGMPVNGLVKAPLIKIRPIGSDGGADNCYSGIIEKINEDEAAQETLAVVQHGSRVCALCIDPTARHRLKAKEQALVCFITMSVILTTD